MDFQNHTLLLKQSSQTHKRYVPPIFTHKPKAKQDFGTAHQATKQQNQQQAPPAVLGSVSASLAARHHATIQAYLLPQNLSANSFSGSSGS